MQSSSQNYRDRYDHRREYENEYENYSTRPNYRRVYTHDINGRVVWYAMRIPPLREYSEVPDVGTNLEYAYVLPRSRNVRAIPYTSSSESHHRGLANVACYARDIGYSQAVVPAQHQALIPMDEEHRYAKSLSNAYRRAYFIRRQSTNPLYASYSTPENSYIYKAYCINPRIFNVDKTQNTELNIPEKRDIACGNSQIHIPPDYNQNRQCKKLKNSKKIKYTEAKPVTAETSMETIMLEEIEYLDEDDVARTKPQCVAKEVMTEMVNFACGDQFVETPTVDSKHVAEIICKYDNIPDADKKTAGNSDIVKFTLLNISSFVFRSYLCISKVISNLLRYFKITKFSSVP